MDQLKKAVQKVKKEETTKSSIQDATKQAFSDTLWKVREMKSSM